MDITAGNDGAAAPERGWPELPVILILAGSIGMVMLDRMIQIFLGPYLVADLGLKASQIGLLAGAVAVCWAVSSFFGGALSDRFGRKRVLVPCMIGFGILSWLSGLARSFEELLIIRGLLGVAEGPCWAIIMTLAQGASPASRRGRNIGIVLGATTILGGIVGPVVCTALAEQIGWRSTFFLAGVPALAMAALVAWKVPEPPPETAPAVGRGGLGELLRIPQLWLCFAGGVLFASAMGCFMTFVPLYLTQVRGFTADSAGLILGMSGLGALIYSLAWPVLSDRIGRKLAIISAAGIGVWMPVLFLIPGLGLAPLGAGAILLSGTAAIAVLMLVVVPAEIAPRHLTATALGFITAGAEGIGSTVGPVVGGVLADRMGLGAPLVMAAVATGLILVIGLGLRETKGRAP